MPGPLNALRKSQSIGPDPYAADPSQISRGEMATMPGIGGVMAGLKSLFRRPTPAARMAPQIEPLPAHAVGMMDKMYEQANPVFKRMQQAGAFGGDRTVGSWAQASPRAYRAAPRASEASYRIDPVQETLGEINPEFTAVGGEGLYNTGKEAMRGLMDPAVHAYMRILGTMGR